MQVDPFDANTVSFTASKKHVDPFDKKDEWGFTSFSPNMKPVDHQTKQDVVEMSGFDPRGSWGKKTVPQDDALVVKEDDAFDRRVKYWKEVETHVEPVAYQPKQEDRQPKQDVVENNGFDPRGSWGKITVPEDDVLVGKEDDAFDARVKYWKEVETHVEPVAHQPKQDVRGKKTVPEDDDVLDVKEDDAFDTQVKYWKETEKHAEPVDHQTKHGAVKQDYFNPRGSRGKKTVHEDDALVEDFDDDDFDARDGWSKQVEKPIGIQSFRTAIRTAIAGGSSSGGSNGSRQVDKPIGIQSFQNAIGIQSFRTAIAGGSSSGGSNVRRQVDKPVGIQSFQTAVGIQSFQTAISRGSSSVESKWSAEGSRLNALHSNHLRSRVDDVDDEESDCSVGMESSAPSIGKPLGLPNNAIVASMLFRTHYKVDTSAVEAKIKAKEEENSKIQISRGDIPQSILATEDTYSSVSSFSEDTGMLEAWRKPSGDLLDYFASSRRTDWDAKKYIMEQRAKATDLCEA
jgi:hypothetical protein